MATETDIWKAPTERIVKEKWGESTQLGMVNGLGGSDRSNVHRVELAGGDAPGTVVVKQAGSFGGGYDPDSKEGPAYGLLNDWAGIAFLDELDDPGPWPRFYGGDRETGVIVLEDLGAARQIDHILLGEDEVQAVDALFGYVRTLADLHRATAGHTDRYDEIRSQLGPRSKRTFARKIADYGTMMKKQGLDSGALSSELARCADTLEDPGPFLVYTHGDSCPDNCLVIDGRVYLLDFEWGEIRHALIDGSYPWIHFPSCWCVNRLPDDLPDRLLTEYRTCLAKGIPEAEDDRQFGIGLVSACVSGFSNNLGDDVFEKDHRWGISTLRQRCRMRIRILARTSERFGFPAIATASSRLGDRFDKLWEDVEPMPIYPAFRS